VEQKKLRVLMLGWEFPPILTGGLGTACYGLSKALSKYVDLTLIIPRAEKSLTLDGVKILGLNYLGLEDELAYEEPSVSYNTFTEVTYVDANLNPYPMGIMFTQISKPVLKAEDVRNLYNTNESYGPNIMDKVATYAEIVTKIALNKEFDVIHAHDWITYPAAVKLKEATGKPLVLHIHSLETDRVGSHAKHQVNAVYEIEKKGMEAADRLIPVSHFTKSCAMDHYYIPEHKFHPVYNAIDTEPTFRIEKKGEEKIVLFLGRITFQKGPEFMAETAFKLLQRYQNVRFYVAGIGDQLQKLKDTTYAMGIYDKFVFAGFLSKPKVREILAQADVYFMPSVSEPFGLSALEAAQFDIPSVLSIQSGVAEVMNHALKADYWDTDRFANYIYALLNYEGIRNDMIENTEQEIDAMSWDQSAQDVHKVYQTCV
jgi:glycosyltransferase involved in cell wall biosynthesis